MPRTISDDEDRQNQQNAREAAFANSLWNDPRINPGLKHLIKQKYPNMPMPGYDEQLVIRQMFDEEKKKRDEEKAAEKLEQEKQSWEAKGAAAKKKYGLTEDGMKEVEEHMKKNNTWDYETAAGYLASKKPKVVEPSYDSTLWHHERKSDWEERMKDPDAWARNQFEQAARKDIARMKGDDF
jgi:hypothetical protein